MCHYVTAVLPAAADVSRLRDIAESHRHALRPLQSPAMQRQLKAGEQYFLTTAGHCDCGTPLGALKARPRRNDRVVEERKLRLKGWSESKIARALDQHDAHEAKERESARPAVEVGLAEWQSLVSAWLGSGATPYVGLLLHFYDDPIDAGFLLQGREVNGRDGVDASTLGHIMEDVLYEFRA